MIEKIEIDRTIKVTYKSTGDATGTGEGRDNKAPETKKPESRAASQLSPPLILFALASAACRKTQELITRPEA